MSEFSPCAACGKRNGQVWIEIPNGEALPFCLQCEPENVWDRLDLAAI
jgi:hypothetical protein